MLVSIPGYIGNYVMDLQGNIYSLTHRVTNSLGRVYTYEGKLIKPIIHGTGYRVVRLSRNGVVKTHRYHRLVAETLLYNNESKEYVNHIDGDKSNNHPDNLEWVTAKENTKHALSKGLMKNLDRDAKGRFVKK